MNESPKITYEGTSHRQTIFLDGNAVGSLKATYADGTQRITGYSVLNYTEDKVLNGSCTSMNQANAFAEFYFRKEAHNG